MFWLHIETKWGGQSTVKITDIQVLPANSFLFVNGFALLSDAPGIGVELVEEVEKKFPFKRRAITTRLHVDGSIVDQ